MGLFLINSDNNMLRYVPDFMPSSIVLIGAGGTGSRLMPALTQLARTCLKKYNPNAWLDKLPIFVIDGDKVEEKNLLRQNFISKDVGQYKSVVLANRYSTAFGVPVYASTDFINLSNTEETLNKSIEFIGLPEGTTLKFDNAIIILAVDSATARRNILRYIFNLNNSHSYRGIGFGSDPTSRGFIIDAGNEDSFGQVKFFTPSFINASADKIIKYLKGCPKQFTSHFDVNCIPMDIAYYENLGESKQELSCVDLPQTLAINAMMSTLILSVVQNVLHLKPMIYDCMRFSLDGSLSTDYNSPRSWAKRGFLFQNNDAYTAESLINKTKLFSGLITEYALFRFLNLTERGSVFLQYKRKQVEEYYNVKLIVNNDGEIEPEPKPVEVTAPKLKTILDTTPSDAIPKLEEVKSPTIEKLTSVPTSIPPETENATEAVLEATGAILESVATYAPLVRTYSDPPTAITAHPTPIPPAPRTVVRTRRAPPPLAR